MRLELKRHPDSHCIAVTRIDVELSYPRAGSLVLTYLVTGTISDVRLPPVTAPTRTDELWRHTCFEAFIRSEPGADYFEFNFAPSTQWAAYRFKDYRRGMQPASEISPPRIETQMKPNRYTLRADVELNRLSTASDLGLAAVIEETNGNKSYWALAHPPGKPDFHHADGFACELP